MKTARIVRGQSLDDGTFGRFSCDKFECVTAELPWRDNHSNVSCIPTGTYEVKWVPAPAKFGGHKYLLQDVPGRFGVLIHAGCYAGDVAKGYASHVQGCILFGARIATVRLNRKLQRLLLNTRSTVLDFETFMNHETFNLEIL